MMLLFISGCGISLEHRTKINVPPPYSTYAEISFPEYNGNDMDSFLKYYSEDVLDFADRVLKDREIIRKYFMSK